MYIDLNLTIDDIPIAMMMTNRQSRIIYANKECCELFGYDSLVDENLDIFIPVDFKKQHAVHVEQFWNQPGRKALGIGRDLPGVKADGSVILIEVGLYPINEEIILILIVDVSIRQEKTVIAELEDLKLKLTNLLGLLGHES
jgi:PAS domain S-box-containing protein